MRNREERCCGNCCWFKHEDIDGFGICYKKDMFPNSPNCADDPCEEYVGNEEATWGTDKFSMKVKDILAWLEKQSESYTKRDVDNAYIEGMVCAKNELEKQGEQKVNYTTLVETGNGGINALVTREVSANDYEEKPANKVEPKFHESEWITNGDYTWKIVEVKPLDYILQSQDGNIVDDSISHVDEQFHSFTIKDAKDGDVLFHSDSASNGIFIFKEIIDKGFAKEVICYCDYDSEDHFCLGEHHTCCWTDAKILYPATKEQRDALMKAMTDAGYTFDFDKKELKKSNSYCQKHCKGFQETGKCFADGDCKAKIEAEQNPAWSEEDDDDAWMNDIISKVENNLQLNKAEIDWLKSLRPQSQWKPSEEQIKVCKEVYADILSAKGFDLGAVNSELNRLEEQLKKPREE